MDRIVTKEKKLVSYSLIPFAFLIIDLLIFIPVNSAMSAYKVGNANTVRICGFDPDWLDLVMLTPINWLLTILILLFSIPIIILSSMFIGKKDIKSNKKCIFAIVANAIMILLCVPVFIINRVLVAG